MRRKNRKIRAHRYAYWLAFGGINPFAKSEDGLVVCHRCDNRRCVNPAHLFLGTARDNVLDAVAKGRKNGLRGERCPTHKLTSEQVMEIRRLYASGVLQKELARRFGLSQATISDIVTGRIWHDLPLIPRGVPRYLPGQWRLTLEQQKEVLRRYEAGERTEDLAAAYGVGKNTILRAIHRVRTLLREAA